MPEYIPQWAPDKGYDLDQFTQDYLDAAEWLLDEEEDRDAIEGWSKEAIISAQPSRRGFLGSRDWGCR